MPALTVNDHRDADKAGYPGPDESQTPSALAPCQLPLHQKHAQQEGGNVDRSSNESVDENVAIQ